MDRDNNDTNWSLLKDPHLDSALAMYAPFVSLRRLGTWTSDGRMEGE